MWIAVVAIANRMTVVHRERQVQYVPGLVHQNWSPGG
jgi:predicted nucleic acid-binding protein